MYVHCTAFVLISIEYAGLLVFFLAREGEFMLHYLHFDKNGLFVFYIVVPHIEIPIV